MNTVLQVTPAKFVPEVIMTLRVLRPVAGIKLMPIVWHASPF